MKTYFTIAVICFLIFKFYVWRKGILFKKPIIPIDKLDWAENFGLVLGSLFWPIILFYTVVLLIIEYRDYVMKNKSVLDQNCWLISMPPKTQDDDDER